MNWRGSERGWLQLELSVLEFEALHELEPLEGVTDDAEISLELTDHCGDTPGAVQYVHGLRVGVIADSEWPLDGAGKLSAMDNKYVHQGTTVDMEK